MNYSLGLRRRAAALLGAALASVAALHLLWAAGMNSGLRGALGGAEPPGWIRPAAAAVAAVLALGAVAMLQRAALVRPLLPAPWAARITWLLAMALLAAALINLFGRTTLERAAFAPLCLVLGAAALIVARGPRRPGLGARMILNVHERHFPAPPEQVGSLVDRLFADDDPLWPTARWPMDRSGELILGAACHHDDVRYTVSEYEPGRRVWFEFADIDLEGGHGFEVLGEDGGARLRHTLRARPRRAMRILWPLLVRGFHDAILDDLLDNAERELTGTVAAPNRYGIKIRLLRALAGRGRRAQRTPDPARRRPQSSA